MKQISLLLLAAAAGATAQIPNWMLQFANRYDSSEKTVAGFRFGRFAR